MTSPDGPSSPGSAHYLPSAGMQKGKVWGKGAELPKEAITMVPVRNDGGLDQGVGAGGETACKTLTSLNWFGLLK